VFQPDPTLTFVPVSREQVMSLVESINQPQISIPGKAPQAAQGHLCGLRNANGSYSILVSLYLADTGENVVYVQDRPELPAAGFAAAEAEGLHFLESMGFMLDNLNFRKLSAEQQALTLERVPLFSPPRDPPTADPVSTPAAIGRFLASF
jgi:hypothetical protein